MDFVRGVVEWLGWKRPREEEAEERPRSVRRLDHSSPEGASVAAGAPRVAGRSGPVPVGPAPADSHAPAPSPRAALISSYPHHTFLEAHLRPPEASGAVPRAQWPPPRRTLKSVRAPRPFRFNDFPPPPPGAPFVLKPPPEAEGEVTSNDAPQSFERYAAEWYAHRGPLRKLLDDVPIEVSCALTKALRWKDRMRQQRIHPKDEEGVIQLLEGGRLEEVVAEIPAPWEALKPGTPGPTYTVTREDLLAIWRNNWLSGNTINAYMKLIEARYWEANEKHPNRELLPKVKVFSSQLYTKLMKYGNNVRDHDQDDPVNYNFDGVKRWTRRVNPFSYDLVFIPLNRGRNHWALAMCRLRGAEQPEIMYLDSFGATGSGVLTNLGNWLRDVYKQHNNGSEMEEGAPLLTSPGPEVPQQRNSYDCGVFCIQFANSLAAGQSGLQFHRDHARYTRRRMCVEFMTGRIPFAP
eukprot:Hpha_TRINITY_DN31330_c0_g1::TRINITY_DN31330_c0_g1_i1::g.194532::m.194532/K08592/SENP1; sentrin-specific protease 1